MTLTKPYAEVLLPLSAEEKETLRASIEADGVRDPLLATEDGRLLDGHHRLDIAPDAPVECVSGSRAWTDAECHAFIFRMNLGRRNLSPDQKKELRRRMKETAKALRKLDPKKFTQAAIARLLGVPRETVRDWFTTNGETANSCDATSRPDARVKVGPAHRRLVIQRVESGESQAAVAADYGVTQQAVSRIVRKERVAAEEKRQLDAAVAALGGGELGVVTGDFRQVGHRVTDGSVQLILSDPPYAPSAVGLFEDLAAFANRVLMPGGLCIAYAGLAYLDQVLAGMARHLFYVWTFAVLHSGGASYFRKFAIDGLWKPAVWFGKPPIRPWWDRISDSLSGGREKNFHKWQQAESEAAFFVEHLSRPGGLVCDPLCGSGTTLVAARRLGRPYVAFEIDPATANVARGRLAAVDRGD
jgi:site-specific DNA-methyltransferase (adenine-specific)